MALLKRYRELIIQAIVKMTPGNARRLKNARCPAKLDEIDFAEVPFDNGSRVVCVSYERAREHSKMPSREYCPKCPYNTDNLGREADKIFARTIERYCPA